MMMKLGINATGLYPGKVGGAEQYLRNILQELNSYADIETYLFLNEAAMPTFEETDRFHPIAIDLSYNHVTQLNGYILYYQIDVWFCPLFHLIPAPCSIPNVTTIFDIQQDYFPENFDPFVLSERKRLTQETIENTDMVLTISEFSKKTIQEKYHVDADKIHVTYLDADSSFHDEINPHHLEEIRKTLPEEFILFPANMWPHKNHLNLIKGFSIAKEKYKLPLSLVFTGAKERETPQIEQFIQEKHLRDWIDYLGYLPQDDMRYVFRCANMLAFPSLFEGFGIPLVEAMASEVPIICSTSSCVPEIAGDAAVLFDAQNPEEIAEAIYRVYSDQRLREQLVQNGRERRELFSWAQCARDTVSYLRSMYQPRQPAPCKLSAHPKVSIITPSYNQGEFIRETIESVLNQTYDNIEYIVMDGGSTDETVRILQSYGDRFRWVSEKDRGQADAVNKGIRIATGEIIGWLNSDDTYYPDAVEKAVKALLSHPEVDMVYGEGDYIDKNSVVTGRYATKLFNYEELANECVICQPTGFFTKEIVEKAGLLNANLHLCMDYELWMRIGKQGTIMYIPERLATSRMYEENKTLSRREEVYSECCREIKCHYNYVPHSWIYGYTEYRLSLNPALSRKATYLKLFLKYNFNRPDYFWDCFKKYRQLQKMKKARQNEPVVQPTTGRFADLWISKEYTQRLIATGGEDQIVITGEHHLPFEQPLVLTVEANRRKQFFRVEQPGPFQFVIEIPEVNRPAIYVTIRSNQTCRPSEISESEDYRELSVRICDVILRKSSSLKDRPLVTIVTPSYNQGKFIRDAIESVLSQDYQNIEYIVVDGGSTDETLQILEEYKDRLTYISEADNGQSDAINKGFKLAKGEILAWLNSDDIYEPGCVSRAVQELTQHPNAALVYGDGYLIDRAGEKIRSFEFSRDFNLWALVNIWDYIMQPATFFRAEAVRKAGYLRDDLHWTMDWDLWTRLAMERDVRYIPEYLACSREYEDTKTSTGSQKRLDEILTLMREHSKKEMPYGYEIYYCSELLGHHKLEEARREEVSNRLSQLLILQPTPDKCGRCTVESNFMIRPYHCAQYLEIEVMQDTSIPVEIYWNDVPFSRKTLTLGITKIPLPQEINENCCYLRVEIQDETLKNIGNQADSWVRMQLVEC